VVIVCIIDVDYPASPEPKPKYLVDYDIPKEPASQRVKFYRELRELRRRYKHFTNKFSTCSVFYTLDHTLATEVYNLVKGYGGDCHLYEATQLLPPPDFL